MQRAAICVACALAVANPAMGQDLPPDALAAYSVGGATVMLTQASPCDSPGDRGQDLEAMMAAARARIEARPDHAAAFMRGMRITSVQQRYIPRSDPVACNQIRLALQHYLRMTH